MMNKLDYLIVLHCVNIIVQNDELFNKQTQWPYIQQASFVLTQAATFRKTLGSFCWSFPYQSERKSLPKYVLEDFDGSHCFA